MIRTQIQLEPRHAAKLKRYASRHGVSMAEAIRRCVDRALSDDDEAIEARYRRAAGLIGSLGDVEEPVPDLSANHDDHLDEAFS